MQPGNRLRALRKAANLTQGELGELAGFAQETISHYENDRRPMQLDHMRALARALNCSVADILPDQDNPDRLTDDERALIQMLRNGDDRQRATAMHMAEAALSFTPEPKRDAA
jgi:transcriptional regulator with XRE-family HTH domain